MRAGAYSPNHIGNDAAIFNLTAEHLRKRGCEVKIYSEEQLNAGAVDEKIIVNMCREQRSIHALQRMEDEGCLVINSGYGIENCTRERMTRILLGSNMVQHRRSGSQGPLTALLPPCPGRERPSPPPLSAVPPRRNTG